MILILYSGGLDSLAMRTVARAEYLDEVKCIWYDIGQPYNHKEEQALSKYPYVEKKILPWLSQNDKLQGKEDNACGNIMIPGRNLALIVNAACQYLPDQVWLGALAGETHEAATDKNYEFLESTEELLNYVLKPYYGSRRIQLSFPLADRELSKLSSISYMLDHGVTTSEITSTSSCLSGEPGNCGECIVCVRRFCCFKQLGFSELYNRDPLESATLLAMVQEMLGDSSHYDTFRKQEILPALTHEWLLSKGFNEFQIRRFDTFLNQKS